MDLTVKTLTSRLAAVVPDWTATARIEDVALAVRFFYAASLWLAATMIFETRNSFRVIFAVGDRVHWPAFWIPWTGAESGYVIAAVLMIAGAFIGALWPQRRWARIIACLGMWEFVAVMISIGELFPICHQWVITSLLLALLPDRFASTKVSKEARESAMLLFWAAQAFFLLSYSMAGLSKFASAAWQTAHGEPSIFTLSGSASLAASYILEKGRLGPLGAQVRDAGLLPGLMFVVAVTELGVFFLAFKPRLHRLAGIAVVTFHLSTYLIMGIFFKASVLLAGALLLGSPFTPRED